MNVKIESIEVKESYVYVKARGEITANAFESTVWSEIVAALRDVFDFLREQKVFKVLLDCRNITGTVSTTLRFQFVSLICKEIYETARLCGQHPKIAMVSNKAMIDPENFEETVAFNRGVEMKVTDDMDEACKWLDAEFRNAADSLPL